MEVLEVEHVVVADILADGVLNRRPARTLIHIYIYVCIYIYIYIQIHVCVHYIYI